jgi:hypothetical protein
MEYARDAEAIKGNDLKQSLNQEKTKSLDLMDKLNQETKKTNSMQEQLSDLTDELVKIKELLNSETKNFHSIWLVVNYFYLDSKFSKNLNKIEVIDSFVPRAFVN